MAEAAGGVESAKPRDTGRLLTAAEAAYLKKCLLNTSPIIAGGEWVPQGRPTMTRKAGELRERAEQ